MLDIMKWTQIAATLSFTIHHILLCPYWLVVALAPPRQRPRLQRGAASSSRVKWRHERGLREKKQSGTETRTVNISVTL